MREHDAPAVAGRENALLLGDGQSREQRQDLHLRGVRATGKTASQQVARFANLTLAGKKHEDVTWRLAPQFLDRRDDRLLQFLLVVRFARQRRYGRTRRLAQRAKPHVDREHAARYLDHRRGYPVAAEMPGKAIGVECGRRDHHLEIRPLAQQLLQIAEQEIDVEAPLVRLVDDDRVVGVQHAIALRLGQQDPVRHQLDVRIGFGLVGEAHLVTDGFTHRLSQLLGDARGDRARGDPARLGVADEPAHAAPSGKANLRQLGGLAGTGFAADDHDRVFANGTDQFLRALRDRQVRRIRKRGAGRRPRLTAGDGPLELRGQPRPLGVGCPVCARTLDATAKARSIPRHGQRQAGFECRGGGNLRGGRHGRERVQTRRFRPGEVQARRRVDPRVGA